MRSHYIFKIKFFLIKLECIIVVEDVGVHDSMDCCCCCCAAGVLNCAAVPSSCVPLLAAAAEVL